MPNFLSILHIYQYTIFQVVAKAGASHRRGESRNTVSVNLTNRLHICLMDNYPGQIVTSVAQSGLIIKLLEEEGNLSSDVFDQRTP